MSPDEVDDAWKPPIPKLDAYQTTTSQNENMCPCPKDYCTVSTLTIQVYPRILSFQGRYQTNVSKTSPSVILQMSLYQFQFQLASFIRLRKVNWCFTVRFIKMFVMYLALICCPCSSSLCSLPAHYDIFSN